MDRTMKTYKGHKIIQSTTTTTVYLPMPGGRIGHYQAIRYLYKIEGKHINKDERTFPWITTIYGAKQYITHRKEQ
tara:strand:- start:133 stop:357 length:225 start_codon:yes stop_codon:yes gene_type:complete